MLGLLPLAAAGFLIWILAQYLRTAAAPQLWSITAVTAAGLLIMAFARLGLKSEFFKVPRESAPQPAHEED